MPRTNTTACSRCHPVSSRILNEFIVTTLLYLAADIVDVHMALCRPPSSQHGSVLPATSRIPNAANLRPADKLHQSEGCLLWSQVAAHMIACHSRLTLVLSVQRDANMYRRWTCQAQVLLQAGTCRTLPSNIEILHAIACPFTPLACPASPSNPLFGWTRLK
jgi:hypothetical protein